MKSLRTSKIFVRSHFLKASLILAFGFIFPIQSYAEDILSRLQREGELTALPEAQSLMIEIAHIIDSPALKEAVAGNRTLQMLRERVRTSLYHVNFKFEVVVEDYPYDPPFKDAFPFRPTLEAMDEVSHFLNLVQDITGFKTDLNEKISQFPFFESLKTLFPKTKAQSLPEPISWNTMGRNPVESYATFHERLHKYGEIASFPEFKESVQILLNDFNTDEIRSFRAQDKAFDRLCANAIKELNEIQSSGAESRIYGAYKKPFPYRKTLQAIERAVLVFDIRERLKYPKGINWHDVELSWVIGDTPKLLELYHYNRYKYQFSYLLSDPEIVLFPDSVGASFEFLMRTRVAPLGIIDVASNTTRIDRHHNSPLDRFHHDGNHVRRTWGYDKRKAQRRGAVTFAQKMEIYREQDRFMKELLAATDPKTAAKEDIVERNYRKHERVISFECFHETALTPDRESLLRDILRGPATPQPFEVQRQTELASLELIRRFDGNLTSGADELGLDMEHPTIIRYFYDRAPGFLANVDNKNRWGFFDSVFDMKKYMPDRGFRTPSAVAKAAFRLLKHLGYENPPSIRELTKDAVDRAGQPELYNYHGISDVPIVKVSGMNALNVVAAEQIQSDWRRNSTYQERWKPTDAKLIDGTIVSDSWSLKRYLEERKVPEFLKAFYKLDKDPATGKTILFEDIRNLPNEFLSKNHQGENLMSGSKAVSIVDRIWHKDLNFKTLDQAERWLVSAAQSVHQAVLDRNANGARNNPIYNVHWLLLPPQNQINDLELVRIGFEARMQKGIKKISTEKAILFNEALSRLYRKIRRNEPIRACQHSLTQTRNANLSHEGK
jgi:hypothetical protein